MDTRFWGPSGWRLLHLITFAYEPKLQREAVKGIFENLPYILPCKFCRYSLTEYMEELPLTPALQSKEALCHWLYEIHNKVNQKLRGQALTKEEDPSFATVKKVYEERLEAGCSQVTFEGWDFLFSVIENHPFSVHGSIPMPDAPVESKVKGDKERNKWNYMTAKERMPYFMKFWKNLGKALPFEDWRKGWNSCSPRFYLFERGVKAGKRELWRIRCCLEKKLDFVNREKFEHVCKKLINHKSGCHKTRRARTCRKYTRKISK
jgi:hypothetical protein